VRAGQLAAQVDRQLADHERFVDQATGDRQLVLDPAHRGGGQLQAHQLRLTDPGNRATTGRQDVRDQRAVPAEHLVRRVLVVLSAVTQPRQAAEFLAYLLQVL